MSVKLDMACGRKIEEIINTNRFRLKNRFKNQIVKFEVSMKESYLKRRPSITTYRAKATAKIVKCFHY